MVMPKGKDYRRAFDCPPYVTWAVAVSCAGIEAYVFGSEIYLLLHGCGNEHAHNFVVGWCFSSLR